MNARKIISVSDESGRLKVDVPGLSPNRRVEVLVVWEELEGTVAARGEGAAPAPTEWPAGYFEQTFGALQDLDFERPAQPDCREIEPLG